MPPKAIFLFCLAMLAAGPAAAEDYCSVPMADWQPREAVARLAMSNGWSVRRIKIDDGCYEVIGQDASGLPLRVRMHPATLQILDAGHGEKAHPHRGRHEDDEQQGGHH